MLAPGDVLGAYQIVRELGRGGMGAVYEARHLALKKTVAIKILFGGAGNDTETQARFLREGQAAARIRHPNVVDVVDVAAEAGVTYLVMEYLPGESLEAHLRRRGALSPNEAADILLSVISAVATAHQHGVVHRDLKPANIILAEGPHQRVVPTVVDFGISKVNDGDGHEPHLTGTGAMLGTPYYMSPEQVTGARDVGPASDQYSLGVILYRCLTGRLPFEGTTLFSVVAAIMSGQYPPPRTLNPALPPELEAVVARAMNAAASERFPSLMGMASALFPWASAGVRAQMEYPSSSAVEPDAKAHAQPASSGGRAAIAAPMQEVLAVSAEAPKDTAEGRAAGVEGPTTLNRSAVSFDMARPERAPGASRYGVWAALLALVGGLGLAWALHGFARAPATQPVTNSRGGMPPSAPDAMRAAALQPPPSAPPVVEGPTARPTDAPPGTPLPARVAGSPAVTPPPGTRPHSSTSRRLPRAFAPQGRARSRHPVEGADRGVFIVD